MQIMKLPIFSHWEGYKTMANMYCCQTFVVLRYMTHFIALHPKKIAAKMGEPTDETSHYGPMARVDFTG
jgi:hypothetical protein